MKLLDASHIEDDDYFLNIIQNDLKAVISDIRSVIIVYIIKGFINFVSDTNISSIFRISPVLGNLLDLLMYYFCKEIRLSLSSLSSEEIQTMYALFQRSGRYKSEARLFRKGRKK